MIPAFEDHKRLSDAGRYLDTHSVMPDKFGAPALAINASPSRITSNFAWPVRNHRR